MKPRKASLPLDQDSPARHLGRVLFLCAALALCSSASAQWNSSYTLCAPQYTGVPFTYKPPAVNGTFVSAFGGNVDNDTGWTGAFRYVLWDGSPMPDGDGAFQVLQDNTTNHIYLSFQMKNDPTYDNESSIILAFDPDNQVLSDGITHPNLQRIIIHPVIGGVGATDPMGAIPPGSVEYWKGWVAGTGPGTGWGVVNPVQQPPLPATFVQVVAQSPVYTGVPGEYTWDVEVEIDNSVLGLPAAPKNFGMYVNMVRIDSSTSPYTDTQFSWPAITPLGISLPPGAEVVLEGNSLPATSMWGTGSLATSCSGVYISPGDITGNHGGTISLNDPNQFSVLMHNSGTRNAQQVFATFQIANYGLPGPDDWVRPGEAFSDPTTHTSNLIPNDPLPSAISPPTTSVNAGTTASLSTGMWTPSTVDTAVGSGSTQTEEQYYQATPDTCIRVLLNSLAPDTTFSVRTTWENFETGTTSVFKHNATVGTKGYKLPPGAANQEFNLMLTHVYTPASTDSTALARDPNKGNSEFKEMVHGCRMTGGHLVILKKKFDDCEDVGSFGYDLTHRGPVKGFTDSLAGDGLEKRGLGYHLVVAPGKKATITTTVMSNTGGWTLCGHSTAGGAFILLSGVFGFGILLYRPRRKE